MASTKNAQESRFRIIETLLLWEGQIDNQRLRSVLGVQAVQASRILAEYATQNRGNVHRPSPRSPYEASCTLKPTLTSGSVEEYLALLQRSEDFGGIIEDARVDFSEPVPQVFATILKACRHGSGVTIEYRSMKTPARKARLIYPHAIVRAGRRWHVRAWCVEREEYRDFVIGRIRSASMSASSKIGARAEDVEWNTKLQLVVAAHPMLSPDQARLIRDEYFSGAVSRRLTVRCCLLSYVIQDLRAAIDTTRETPPEFQIAVVNVESLRPYLFPAMSETGTAE